MKKSDLVSGKHVVKYRDGKLRFVGHSNGLLDSDGVYVHALGFYNERLDDVDGDKAMDIVAVYELNEVWKREEPTMASRSKRSFTRKQNRRCLRILKCKFCKRRANMKLSEYIEKYGDCEVTDEIDKCIVKVPKMVYEPKTIYDLKYGDEYFFLTESGIVQGGIWRDDMISLSMLSIGNMFLTEEDAEFAIERLEVIAELKKYAKEFSDEEWENRDLNKHCIRYDFRFCIVYVMVSFSIKGTELYFESEEKAKEAIEAVGDDRIKKYYLGVKE